MGEVMKSKELPIRYVGFSSAFRREAGSYGKDTRGILRVHQFDKVEMVSFVKDGEDDKEHDYLLSLEEKLFKALDIPYQVVKMCTGDFFYVVKILVPAEVDVFIWEGIPISIFSKVVDGAEIIAFNKISYISSCVCRKGYADGGKDENKGKKCLKKSFHRMSLITKEV